jgi:hypothetical protein
MSGIATLRAVVLDCPDPHLLAAFYREQVGGEIAHADEEWVVLQDGGDVKLSFQLASDYQPPVWPSADRGQQFHIEPGAQLARRPACPRASGSTTSATPGTRGRPRPAPTCAS